MYSINFAQLEKSESEMESHCKYLQREIEILDDIDKNLNMTYKNLDDEIFISLLKHKESLLDIYGKMVQMKNAMIYIMDDYKTAENRVIDIGNEEIFNSEEIDISHMDLNDLSKRLFSLIR